LGGREGEKKVKEKGYEISDESLMGPKRPDAIVKTSHQKEGFPRPSGKEGRGTS